MDIDPTIVINDSKPNVVVNPTIAKIEPTKNPKYQAHQASSQTPPAQAEPIDYTQVINDSKPKVVVSPTIAKIEPIKNPKYQAHESSN
ncbi:hypothetical protein CYY_007519 [Polysphondylium violaceum]|uniref:Uncharacterized protein n=1 Tax=Polysphondylium violaceum TaxID=133409 RepID=A0A8J4PRS1_9MYCE|nr:hypothetical protein CYY_007519 [Polysphondylium violaceum]